MSSTSKQINRPKAESSSQEHTPFIKSIKVVGYQSLYNVEIECGMFTVVHGESDVGKSAFFRAISALVLCESGDSFISFGESSSRVEITLGSETKVSWEKERLKSPTYEMEKDGKKSVWRRVKSTPSDIQSELKMFHILEGEDAFIPNLKGQFDSLFLIFTSAGKRSKVIGFLVSNILLNGIKQANINRNSLEADVRSLNEMLGDYRKEEFYDAENGDRQLAVIDESVRQINLIGNRSNELLSLGDRNNELTRKIGHMTEVTNRMEECVSIGKESLRLVELNSSILTLKNRLDRIDGVLSHKFSPLLEDGFLDRTEHYISTLDKIISLKYNFMKLNRVIDSSEIDLIKDNESLESARVVYVSKKEKMIVHCPKCGNDISLMEYLT